MLGEGIVSFGVRPSATSLRKRKSSPKIVSPSPIFRSTCIAAGVHSTVPFSDRNSTFIVPEASLTPSSA